MSQHDAPTCARLDLEAWRKAVWQNRFHCDRFFGRLLRRHLGGRYTECEPRLRRVAEETGATLNKLVMESNRDENLPSLHRHDADGRPIEEVVFHPAYHAVGKVFWSSGVLAVLSEPRSEVLSGAIAYLLAQHGEAGHACPVACTAGAIKLLQKLGSGDQRRRYLPSLLETNYDLRLHAAQFVTEVQGGSDVGSNSCQAVPVANRPGCYRISGEKWFCSAADAGLFVVSARVEGAAAGTRGLGLFLVPRMINGTPNGFVLRRLKYKLGTRSMATGEIEFSGALGEAIGPLADGFRNLVGIVLDTSRVHNALGACGSMRRALVEAHSFAQIRVAFDRRIIEYPQVKEILARMRLRTMVGLATTFRLLAMTDRAATGETNDDFAAARRIGVMINKYWTAVASTQTIREGIEILGGNGTIEDFSVLPRLYRDAIVFESWEGTHNTLCAQVLRDFANRGLHRAWLRQLGGEIEGLIHSELRHHVARVRDVHRAVSDRIGRLVSSDPEAAAAHIRHVVDWMCRLTDVVALLTQAQWDLGNAEGREVIDALELYWLHELDHTNPQDDLGLTKLNARLASKL